MKQTYDQCEAKMKKTIAVLEGDFKSIRAGRANPAVLDRVMVDYYGSPTPVSQMAAVAVTEARTIMITPWDKSTLKLIEKAILISDIGINPGNDGTAIRLSFPPLTEERRKEIVKGINKSGEESKIAIRSIRRDANETYKTMKKNKQMSEDEQKEWEKKVQDLTDRFIKEIDLIVKNKEQEILSI
ncbi:MAG: ribosome recycling factor [Oscillospiraceae bacterium]